MKSMAVIIDAFYEIRVDLFLVRGLEHDLTVCHLNREADLS